MWFATCPEARVPGQTSAGLPDDVDDAVNYYGIDNGHDNYEL